MLLKKEHIKKEGDTYELDKDWSSAHHPRGKIARDDGPKKPIMKAVSMQRAYYSLENLHIFCW